MNKKNILTIIFFSCVFFNYSHVVAMSKDEDNYKKLSRESYELFICQKCGQLLKNEEDAKLHSRLGNCEPEETLSEQVIAKGYCELNNKVYTCLICNKEKIRSMNSMIEHIANDHLLRIDDDCLIPEDVVAGENPRMTTFKIGCVRRNGFSRKYFEDKGLMKRVPVKGSEKEYSFQSMAPNCEYYAHSTGRMLAHLIRKHAVNPLKSLDEQKDTILKKKCVVADKEKKKEKKKKNSSGHKKKKAAALEPLEPGVPLIQNNSLQQSILSNEVHHLKRERKEEPKKGKESKQGLSIYPVLKLQESKRTRTDDN